jgi:glycosyl transferase family 25
MLFSRIINLDKRPERWRDMQIFIQKNPGLDLSRFTAIEPTPKLAREVLHPRLHQTFLDGWPRYSSDEIKGLGAVGCFLSHKTLWKEFLDSNATIALILEDDLDSKDAYLLSELVYGFIKKTDWDFALLGWVGTLGDPYQHFTGTHAYMLTKPMAHRLLSFSFPFTQQVDYFMNAVLKASPDMRMQVSTKRLRQKTSPSDILTWVWLDILAVVWVVLCILIILFFYFGNILVPFVKT